MLLAKGARGTEVLKLQQGLAHFGFHPGGADGIFGAGTERAVEAWQEKAGLYADGMFGKGSQRVWDEWCQKKNTPQFAFGASPEGADPEPAGDRLKWVTCKATPMPNGHGFKSLILREDAAEAYNTLRDEVVKRGGYMTTAGGKRALSASVGKSRSKTSFHYTGRAFDLATYSALGDPTTDPFICTREEGSRHWDVWCRVTDKTAPLAHTVPTVTLNATVCRHKKTSSGKRYTQLETVEWTGQAFPFTEMAAALGFDRIRGRSSFFSGGNYMGAEWWHFQYVEGLVVGQSTFGGELLRVYSRSEVEALSHWRDVKDAVYGKSWF